MVDLISGFIVGGTFLIGGYIFLLYYRLRMVEFLLLSIAFILTSLNLLIVITSDFTGFDFYLLLSIVYISFILLFVAFWYISGFSLPWWVTGVFLLGVTYLTLLSLNSRADLLFPLYNARTPYMKLIMTSLSIYGLVSFLWLDVSGMDDKIVRVKWLWVFVFTISLFSMIGSFVIPSEIWLYPVALIIPILAYLIGIAPEGLLFSKPRLIVVLIAYRTMIDKERLKKSNIFQIDYLEYINRVQKTILLEGE